MLSVLSGGSAVSLALFEICEMNLKGRTIQLNNLSGITCETPLASDTYAKLMIRKDKKIWSYDGIKWVVATDDKRKRCGM